MRIVAQIALVLSFVLPLRADGLAHKVWHYANSHKQVLARDILVTGTYTAVAATEPCYRPNPCSDQSEFFPSHPTHWQVYRISFAFSGAFVLMNHLQYHFAPESRTVDVIDWMETGMIVTNEAAYDLPSNLRFRDK